MLASLPVIQDPWFYAVAVPAVLITGLSKSGFASGFGSLATPMMALTLPVPQAAAIMLPLLLAMDATGLQQLWRERHQALVRHLLPWALLGTVIGTLIFGLFTTQAVAGVLGALTLAFLAQRLLFPPRPGGPPPPGWVGSACATVSGFTSFVAHAGGPPISAYLLPLKLPPRELAATMAVYFGVVNLSKIGPYAWLGLIDARNMFTALLLMPLAPLGVWAGVWLTKRVSAALFYRLAYAGMFLTGVKLLYDGLR
ncbi:MAG: sulfite exporter TauE/SafE family protein [Leptothrix sp. (in: Bacteria)]|nr:sulfite exporter TauE/SafE family protein [Leptothrix sp. (in: b-proteobacteria)]